MFTIEELNGLPVIVARRFLPQPSVDALYDLIKERYCDFGTPRWTDDQANEEREGAKKRSLCSATDIWFPFATDVSEESQSIEVPPVLYDYVEHHLFHQGVLEFCNRTDSDVFHLLPGLPPDGRIHIITYGDGDYYNWHRDHSLGEGPLLYGSTPARHNLFTFSLSLCRNPTMEGGNLLFMSNSKTSEISFEHNCLVIFPSTVYHAATPVKMQDGESVSDRRISIQFWMAGSQALSRSQRARLRW